MFDNLRVKEFMVGRIKTVKTYVQYNYRVDPDNKYLMGTVGVGLEAEVEPGESEIEVLANLRYKASVEAREQISSEQKEAGFIETGPTFVNESSVGNLI